MIRNNLTKDQIKNIVRSALDKYEYLKDNTISVVDFDDCADDAAEEIIDKMYEY